MFFIYHAIYFLILPAIVGVLVIKLLRRRDYVANFLERFGYSKGLLTPKNLCSPNGRERELDSVPSSPCFWFHAVSAGEVTAAIPLVNALRSRYPASRIVFSTATPAGRAVLAANHVELDHIFYSPIDLAWVVQRVVASIKPTLFLLVETDLWPALLQCLAQRRVPSVLVNGRISQRRVRFGGLFRPVCALLNHSCVQTEVDAERLMSIGVNADKITVTGNLKFAQALYQLDLPPLSDERFSLPHGSVLLIAGSTHEGEEAELLDGYFRLREKGVEIFLMIAPRHLERLKSIEDAVAGRGYISQRWSGFDAWRRDRVTLVDSVGNLPRLYSLAHFVFVGGSFVKRGGHNVLEPAVWGKPIFFGPYMENYSSIAEMLEREEGAIRVRNGADLASHVERLVNDPCKAAEMGRQARAVVAKNQGAVESNVTIIEDILSQQLGKAPAHALIAKTVEALLIVQVLFV